MTKKKDYELIAKMLRLNRGYITDYQWVVTDFALAFIQHDSKFQADKFFTKANCDCPEIGTPESVCLRNAMR